MAVFNIEGYNSYSGCDITVTASLPLINGEAVGKYYTLGSIQTLSISTHQDKRPVRSLGVINAKDYVMGPRTIAGSMVFAVFNRHFATEIMKDLKATDQEVILPDEIPALDITINFANEYGRMSRMAIYGVKIINEGQVMSINDLYTENTYQFVALGLEPLSAEDPSESKEETGLKVSGKSDYYTVESFTQSDARTITKEFSDNSGIKVSNQIKNNEALIENKMLTDSNTITLNSSIELSVETVDALSENDLGLAVFKLYPIQTDGYIYIYEGNKKLQTPNYTLLVTKNNTHNMGLSAGTYTAQYIGPSSKQSNVVNFSIEIISSKVKISNDTSYPIIEKVTHNSIVVSNNDNRFSQVNIFKTGGELMFFPIGKTPLTISGLESDTEYNIFTSNEYSANKSDIISVKTFEFENQEIDIFKDYITANKNLFVGNLDIINQYIGNINMADYNTLIDMVLALPDCPEKQEALIYAVKATNQLIDSYNASNVNHIKETIQDHPFDNEIKLSDYEKASFYICRNKKNTLAKTIKASEDSFYGTANKHYCVYGIDENGNKSIKKDFIICKNSAATSLANYMNTQQYKDIDLSYYDAKYKTYENNTIQAMAIMDNCYCDLNLLEPPYVYQEEDGKVYANVKYNNLNKNNKYYLVCANLYEALDFVPLRKIPFDFDSEIINLNDYYLGLLRDEKYLFWIETDELMKISKPYIFRYHEIVDKADEFDKIRKDELRSKISNIQSEFVYNYGNEPVANELFNYIYDYEPQEKDFTETAAIELINYFESSLYCGNTLDALFELLKVIHNKNQLQLVPNIIIDRKNRCMKIEKLDGFYINALNFTMDSVTRLYDFDNIVHYNEGYVMVYLVSDSMIYKSGFVLIDCMTGNYKCTDELYDYIKEGVI